MHCLQNNPFSVLSSDRGVRVRIFSFLQYDPKFLLLLLGLALTYRFEILNKVL